PPSSGSSAKSKVKLSLICTCAKWPGLTFKPKISAKNSAAATLSLAGTIVWSKRMVIAHLQVIWLQHGHWRILAGLFLLLSQRSQCAGPGEKLVEHLMDQLLARRGRFENAEILKVRDNESPTCARTVATCNSPMTNLRLSTARTPDALP